MRIWSIQVDFKASFVDSGSYQNMVTNWTSIGPILTSLAELGETNRYILRLVLFPLRELVYVEHVSISDHLRRSFFVQFSQIRTKD